VIRIKRGPEPSALRDQRGKYLPLACAAFDTHGPGSRELKDTLSHYDGGKRALFRRQHRKCAFCERRSGLLGQPLEHFRPKAEALRNLPKTPSDVDDSRYWWLCWTWENHLFACVTCNSRAQKSNYFPLKKGTTPLPSPPRPCKGIIPRECFDLSRESPLLLDPADSNIEHLEHLVWSPVDPRLPRPLWTWDLHSPTPEGSVTANILGLRNLCDDINDRYRETVWPRFRDEIEGPMNAGERARARAAWTELCEGLASAKTEHAAASWWQLERLRASSQELIAVELPRAPRP
jgi:hypothetical protein